MKLKIICISLLLGLGMAFAQSQYPLVSIHDIQYIDSVGTKGWSPSIYTNDTVRVVGVMMISPLADAANNNRNTVMYYGNRYGVYIQDTSAKEWGGLNVLISDTSAPETQATFFDLTDTAQVVELTGVVSGYGQTNEMFLLPSVPVNIIGTMPRRPLPQKFSLSDFIDNGVVNKDNFKYTGMYVEFDNVISSDRNTSSGGFTINDGKGNSMVVYGQSRYFRLGTEAMPGSKYQPPQDGTIINSIRGIITVYNDGFELLPIYPNDLTITLTPPTISGITRDPVQVNTNKPVTISAKVVGGSGAVIGVALHYQIGNQDRVTVPMTKSSSDTTIYSAVINGIATDSTLVNYFITSNDNIGLTGYNPSDTIKGNYFYQVLNEPLTIRDVQYSPYGSGYSSYNGYYVTLTGIVTADTSDIPGFGTGTPLRVYMQDKSAAWSGIMIGVKGINGADVLKFKRGDSVTLTGRIMENYSVTSIDSLTSIKVNSSNNPEPAPVDLKTGDIDKITGATDSTAAGERWESVLVDYKNVTVTDENADGDPGPISSNHGEIFVNDGSGDTRVELQDGNHNYNNDWDSTLADNPANIYVMTGSKFSELKGILFYSYSYYKLVPRKNDDLIGFVTGIKKEINTQPVSYTLEQNYPNPFNPSTTISYSIPSGSRVTLKIYNILGQEVKTLVNDYMASGKYTINFNADNLSSGIYFYTLHAGNYYQVKKMILLK